MSRYRKIEVRIWTDEKFRLLSPLPPSGQSLWLFLLTGPHTGPIPGLFRAGQLAMAEELGWSRKALARAFEEVVAQNMAQVDWQNRVIWIPKAIAYNLPQSPNVIKSWGEAFKLIPECALKTVAIDGIRGEIGTLGEAYLVVFDEITHRKAFDKPSGNPSSKSSGKPMPNQRAGAGTGADKDSLSGAAGFLTDERLEIARQQGFADHAWIEAETIKFCNYYHGKTLRNPTGAWLNWLHKGREYAAKHPATSAPAKARKTRTVVVEQNSDAAAYQKPSGRFARPIAEPEEVSA